MPVLLEAAEEAEGEVVVDSVRAWVPTVLMAGSSCSSPVHKQGMSGSSEMVLSVFGTGAIWLLFAVLSPQVPRFPSLSSLLEEKGRMGKLGLTWPGIISPNSRHLNKV